MSFKQCLILVNLIDTYVIGYGIKKLNKLLKKVCRDVRFEYNRRKDINYFRYFIFKKYIENSKSLMENQSIVLNSTIITCFSLFDSKF